MGEWIKDTYILVVDGHVAEGNTLSN